MFYRAIVLFQEQFDGLMYERHNSIANTLELRLSYSNPYSWSPE